MDKTIGQLREELAACYVKLSGKEAHASDCSATLLQIAFDGAEPVGG